MFCISQGREARLTNVLAENDVITQDGLKDLSYTLVTQRDSDNKEMFQCYITATANITGNFLIMFTGPAALNEVSGTSSLLPSRVAQVHRAVSGSPLEPLHVPR